MGYDPDTGSLTWRVMLNARGPVGAEVGCVCKRRGYRVTRIDGISYLVHRVIWFYVHGAWPEHELDHINGVRHDNRIANLRIATRSQNACNTGVRKDSGSRVKGVRWHVKSKKWQARIIVNNRDISLGYFNEKSEAEEARLRAEEIHHGQYRRAA